MKTVKIALLTLATFIVLASIGVYAGFFDFSADNPHWEFTQRIIETARERSIARQARDIPTPQNLKDPSFIASGAGEYAEMCAGCHLAPGEDAPRYAQGFTPSRPISRTTRTTDPLGNSSGSSSTGSR